MRRSQEAGPAAGSRRTANDYNAFLEFAAGKATRLRILEQFDEWLREKGIEADLSRNQVEKYGDRELSLIHRRAHHGHDVSGRLLEPTDDGVWKSEVLLHVHDRDSGWLRIRVTNDRGRFVAVPRLATYVMDVIDTLDGPAQYTSEPRVLRGTGAEEFLDLVCDPNRAAPIFAAGSDHTLPFDRWVAKVGQWTKQVRGMAHVIVLDPPATQVFHDLVGASHSVRPGTIRTFLPEVDPAVAVDGLRHRVLGAKRLADQPDGVTMSMFGRIARESASARILPNSVAQVERAVRRVADEFLLDQLSINVEVPAVATDAEVEGSTSSVIVEATDELSDALENQTAQVRPFDAEAEQGHESPSTLDDTHVANAASSDAGSATSAQVEELQQQVDQYLASVRLVQDVLGITRLDEEQLRSVAALADQARLRIEALEQLRSAMAEKEAKADVLEDTNRELDERLKDAELDLAIAEEERAKAADEVRYLRMRLRDVEDYEGAISPIPDDARTTYPESFDELLEWVEKPEFKARGIIFCGDAGAARDLDDSDTLQQAVRQAWEVFLTLQSYVMARHDGAFDGGIDSYLGQTPTGYRTYPKGKFASTETRQTMQGHGKERKFPVPTGVKKSGFAVMKAHFKLAKIGMVSPRMYVLDQFTVDGRVYVGYIGRHLTNTKTN